MQSAIEIVRNLTAQDPVNANQRGLLELIPYEAPGQFAKHDYTILGFYAKNWGLFSNYYLKCLENASRNYGSNHLFAKIHFVTEGEDFANMYDIDTLPAVLVFNDEGKSMLDPYNGGRNITLKKSKMDSYGNFNYGFKNEEEFNDCLKKILIKG